jgi:type IV pilus assembly protein PilA
VLNRLRLNTRDGFTLIELLVVIAIIVILAAIAIPQFAAYRRGSFDSQVRSDLKNASVAQESYFVSLQNYNNCNPCTGADLTGFDPTNGVNVIAVAVGQTFTLTGTHNQCAADESWTYSSVTGTVTPVPGAVGGCL